MTEELNAAKGGELKDGRIKQTSRRILVIDDEPCILELFPYIFPLPNYLVALAADDRAALQLAETQVFDLAFVDYRLQEVDGAVVARKLRELQPNMKVVLMSGYVVEDKTGAMELAGARVFLAKPFLAEQAQAIAARLFHETELKLTTSMDSDGVRWHE
ncbi:MAG: response regulator [Verrucomicrobiia bacterium]|jgi:DNA-binding NtrC family response regulator